MFISCPYLPWRYFKVIQGTSHFSFCLHKCRTLFSVNCFCLTLNYNGLSFIRDMVRNSATFSLPFWLLNSYRQNPYIGSYRRQQRVVTLRVCASRWTEVCGGIGSQRMQQRKMAPLLKITIVLVICSIFVECRSDKGFFVICEIGLKANKSQIIHNFARFVVHEWLMFRVLACARTRR